MRKALGIWGTGQTDGSEAFPKLCDLHRLSNTCPSIFISLLRESNHQVSQYSERFKKTVDADVDVDLVGAQQILWT